VVTQVMVNNVMDFDTFTKHSPVNSGKDAAILSILIMKIKNRFKIGTTATKKINVLLSLWLHFQLT